MHPRNFSPHHTVTTFKIGEWHDNCELKGNLDLKFRGSFLWINVM